MAGKPKRLTKTSSTSISSSNIADVGRSGGIWNVGTAYTHFFYNLIKNQGWGSQLFWKQEEKKEDKKMLVNKFDYFFLLMDEWSDFFFFNWLELVKNNLYKVR